MIIWIAAIQKNTYWKSRRNVRYINSDLCCATLNGFLFHLIWSHTNFKLLKKCGVSAGVSAGRVTEIEDSGVLVTQTKIVATDLITQQ